MPHYKNFYLQSHNAIKGTARSAHYVILADGGTLDFDQIKRVVSFLHDRFPLTRVSLDSFYLGFCGDSLIHNGATGLLTDPKK